MIKKKIILIKYVSSITISGEIFIVSQGAASNGKNAENIISIWKFYDMIASTRKQYKRRAFWLAFENHAFLHTIPLFYVLNFYFLFFHIPLRIFLAF